MKKSILDEIDCERNMKTEEWCCLWRYLWHSFCTCFFFRHNERFHWLSLYLWKQKNVDTKKWVISWRLFTFWLIIKSDSFFYFIHIVNIFWSVNQNEEFEICCEPKEHKTLDLPEKGPNSITNVSVCSHHWIFARRWFSRDSIEFERVR